MLSSDRLKRVIGVLVCIVLAVSFYGIGDVYRPIEVALASGIAPPAYGTIQNNGTPVTQRNTVNFSFSAGAGSCSDSGGLTLCTITGTATGSGTVTSVSFTGGLISVATPTTTPALTVAGTSGGLPYFSSASTWASSAAGTAGHLVLWGGAGSAPTDGGAPPSAGSSITIGAIASLPACSTAGNTYFTTDGYYTFVCDGTNNQPFHLGVNMQQPLSATFAAAGSATGSPTATTTHGGIIFSASGGGATVSYRAKSLANSAPYTVFLGVYLPPIGAGNNVVGIALRDSVTGKSGILGYRGTTAPILLAATDSSISSVVCSSDNTGGSGVPAPGLWYFKLQVDGSGNVLPFVASDRYNWVQNVGCNSTLTAIFGAGVTPNQWGLAIESNTTAAGVTATWLDFSEVAGLH